MHRLERRWQSHIPALVKVLHLGQTRGPLFLSYILYSHDMPPVPTSVSAGTLVAELGTARQQAGTYYRGRRCDPDRVA